MQRPVLRFSEQGHLVRWSRVTWYGRAGSHGTVEQRPVKTESMNLLFGCFVMSWAASSSSSSFFFYPSLRLKIAQL